MRKAELKDKYRMSLFRSQAAVPRNDTNSNCVFSIENPHRCQEMDCTKTSGEMQLFLIASLKIKIYLSEASLVPPLLHLFLSLCYFFFIIPFFLFYFAFPLTP